MLSSTLDDNIYELPGLDPEAASTLADRILAHQTPTQVLAALRAGDVKLDVDESKQQDKSIFEQKTESILRCIDYSHSNLSPEAQQLLLCLAPFTSVIWQDMLDQYTE